MDPEKIKKLYEALKESEKPPKDWWDSCVTAINKDNPGYTETQVAAVCGHIYYHQPGGPSASFEALNEQEFPGGFEGCVKEMSTRPDVNDPEALCAYIGRKWGKMGYFLETIGELKKGIGVLQSESASRQKELSDAKTSIAALQGQIQGLQAKVSTFEGFKITPEAVPEEVKAEIVEAFMRKHGFVKKPEILARLNQAVYERVPHYWGHGPYEQNRKIKQIIQDLESST